MKKILARSIASVYGFFVWLCRSSYRWFPFRVRKVNARVISIGNITWGGTGKTPMTAKLARTLSHYGKRVAVLTRGYAGGDEAEELKKRLPHIPILVGRDRVKSAQEAVKKYGAEILILDDGFQHWRLHRDIDIVTLNATQPFGPGGLIPMGTLREPLENLSRASVFVLTKSNIGSKNLPWIRQKINSIKPGAAIFEAVHKAHRLYDPTRGRILGLSEVRNHRIATICAVGDPFSFEKMVENLGADIQFATRFEDHHSYKESELLAFLARCKELGLREAVTTEKDWIRMEPVIKSSQSEELKRFPFLSLQIEFRIDDEEDFIRRCVNS